ncbi:MAG: hypothetical protein R3A44_39030 [Caldilineaceae bacterium]
MEQQATFEIVTGIVLILVGLSGWLLPYEYNLLKPKRLYRNMLPEQINRLLPKILGSLFIIGGLIMFVG